MSRLIMKNILLVFIILTTSSSYGQSLIDMKNPNYDHCTEIFKNDIYIFGGRSSSGKSYKYNLKTKVWQELSSQISRISGATSKLYKGKVYIFGGSGFKNSIQVYDIKENKWEILLDSIPTGLYWSTSEIFNNKIYLIGGYFYEAEDGQGLDVMQIFDLKTRKWETKKMPYNFRSPNSVKHNELFYVWEHNILYSYCPKTNVWTTENLPDNIIKNGQEAVSHNDYILFIGGTDGTHFGATPYYHVTKYYPSNKSIERLKYTSIFCRQYNFGAIIHKENLYIIGGRDCKSWKPIDKIEIIENLN